ncbi:MAG TPA: BamA/TamA family outer membrane protein, partial [Myxococcota bacterium]|nr:BamA/TamA family outer membrane protein [Myxococcota bacterium]
EAYLKRFNGLSASEENRMSAEAFLSACYFSSSATCQFTAHGIGNKLLCHITTKRIITKIAISDVPASLLETELRRKLPIERGEAIDLETDLKDVVAAIPPRVEAYLRKSGYYGASVSVKTRVSDNSINAEFIIKIENGAFARVHDVKVIGDSVVSPKVVTKLFKRMCLGFDKIFEAFSLGTLSCYSKDLERETIQGLQDRLAKRGYVQARVRVSHHWIDPSDQSAPKYCQQKTSDKSYARCVNLRAEIDKGQKVTWSVNVRDRIAVSRNAFLRFLGSLFEVDLLSRATASEDSDETPQDQVIIEQELLKPISFASAKNVDEQEIAESAAGIRKYLVGIGYINAEVVPHVVQNTSHTVVNFDVYAQTPQAVRSVKLKPESYLSYVTQDELDKLVDTRSVAHNGHLSYEEIEAARLEIEHRLHDKGFSDVVVKADLASADVDRVSVEFYVESKKREIVDGIAILNGLHDLNEELAPLLSNCDNYLPPRRHSKTRVLCHDSSFIEDKLEDDVKRVTEYYQNQGFLYAEVAPEVVKTDSGNFITFKLFDRRYGEKSERPLTRQEIKDIIIYGNLSTRTDVIKRLFPYERKKASFDPVSLKKGLANVRESGAFSRLDHKVLFAERDSEDAYFLLQVVEKPSLAIDTAIAFSTDQLFSLEASIEQSNLFSSLLRLNTSLALGLFWGRQSTLKNTFIWPYIFGSPVTLTVQAPMIVYDDRTHWSKPVRRLRSKVAFDVGFRLSATVTPYLRYWLQVTQEDESPVLKPSFRERIVSLDGLIPTIKQRAKPRGVLKPGINYVQLDNSLEPRKGVDLDWWTEFSGGPFLGRPPFINIGLQNRFFIPLGPLTLALRANLMRAFVEPSQENFKELARVSEAMDWLGGDRSIRGYKDGEIGITDLASPQDATAYAGYFSNIANVELRFPIAKTSIGGFSGALFADQGTLIPCNALFKCGENRSLKNLISSKGFALSVGAGLRYQLPVGPISLDYGISPLTGQSRLHFIFGFSF